MTDTDLLGPGSGDEVRDLQDAVNRTHDNPEMIRRGAMPVTVIAGVSEPDDREALAEAINAWAQRALTPDEARTENTESLARFLAAAGFGRHPEPCPEHERETRETLAALATSLEKWRASRHPEPAPSVTEAQVNQIADALWDDMVGVAKSTMREVMHARFKEAGIGTTAAGSEPVKPSRDAVVEAILDEAPGVDTPDDRMRSRLIAESVLALWPGRSVAEVKAEAVRDASKAANRDWLGFKNIWGSNPVDQAVVAFATKALDWIDARADRIERGES